MKRWILAVLALAAVVVIVGLTELRLEPGPVETFLATTVKHLLVRRSSRVGKVFSSLFRIFSQPFSSGQPFLRISYSAF
jgi:hypothetical protein